MYLEGTNISNHSLIPTRANDQPPDHRSPFSREESRTLAKGQERANALLK